MRAAALVLGLFAVPALADPPVLPSQMVRRSQPSPFVIGPSNIKNRHAPVADVEALKRRVAIARGLERVELLDELTGVLDHADVPDDQLERLVDETSAYYVMLLHEPALETSIHADELLVRGAKNVMGRDEVLARQSLARVIAHYPRSPFVADARMALAELAERKRAYGQAVALLREVVASRDKTFLAYARLRLGWALWLAADAKAGVFELTSLVVDGDDPLLVETALDLLPLPYAKRGRADLAAALFDRGDRTETANRLRRLAVAYAGWGKFAEATVVLRAAIARETDPTAICLDRADLLYLVSQDRARNHVDVAIATAQLDEARKTADPSCRFAADNALARAKGPAR